MVRTYMSTESDVVGVLGLGETKACRCWRVWDSNLFRGSLRSFNRGLGGVKPRASEGKCKGCQPFVALVSSFPQEGRPCEYTA